MKEMNNRKKGLNLIAIEQPRKRASELNWEHKTKLAAKGNDGGRPATWKDREKGKRCLATRHLIECITRD